MSKTMALDNARSVAVVKSPPIAAEPKAPAKRKPPLLPTNLHFERFTELERAADDVLEGWERYTDEKNKPKDPHRYFTNSRVYVAMQTCKELRTFFDDMLAAYVEDRGGEWIAKKSAVSGRIGLLIGSFPNGAPASPEVYARNLAEHINVNDPTPYALESACRTIEATCKFLPVLAEILPVLREQESRWDKRWCAVNQISLLQIKFTKGRLPDA
jgi:hypothetical protein